jgi:two-component system sensor histidine kinase UhpB
MRTRLGSAPLLWRVLAANAAVLTLAFTGLVVAPVTVSAPVAASELAVLIAGLVGLIVLNLVVLRPALRPLEDLAETMRRHDPLSPGRRAPVPGDPALAALAQAFNEMLERLERERRDSARKALAVQEAERWRIAQELHDEVGQTLTGVMLQVEGLAPVVPAAAQEQLDELPRRPGGADQRRAPRRGQCAELELRCRDGRATLTVRDDGRGLAPGSQHSSNGIRGMRERALPIGADLSIDSPEHGGTEVKLSLPPPTPEPR